MSRKKGFDGVDGLPCWVFEPEDGFWVKPISGEHLFDLLMIEVLWEILQDNPGGGKCSGVAGELVLRQFS
jgi:hypothetical protein